MRFILLLSLLAYPCFSQEYQKFPSDYYSTLHLDIYSGLSSDSITEIFEDSRGYIWIGSYDGIMRFDGTAVEIFESHNRKNLKAHSANCFVEDDTGLWIGTGQGLALYSNDRFTTHKKDAGLCSNTISSLVLDDNGTLWVGSNQGLQFRSGSRFESPVYPGRNPFSGHSVETLLYHQSLGIVACLSTGGIYTHSESDPFLVPETGTMQISSAALYDDNSVLLGTRNGGLYLLTEHNTLTPFRELVNTNLQIRDIHFDKESGALYIVDDASLFRIQNGTVQTLNAENSQHPMFESILKRIFIDSEGNIYAGTRSAGLFILRESVFRNFDNRNGLGGEAVNSVAEFPSGQFWIASDSGLYCLSGDEFVSNELTRLLSGERIKHLQSSGESLYISTISAHGVVIWDGQKVRSINEEEGLKNLVIKKTLLDSSGRLWISTSKGISILETDGSITIYSKDNGFISDEIYDLYEDSRQRIWVCTVKDGLLRFEENGSYQRFSPREGIDGEMVFSVREDYRGDYWVSTAAGCYLITADDSIHPVSDADGLPYSYMYNLQPRENRLYMTSVKGFSYSELDETKAAVIDRQSEFSITHYDWNSGLVSSPNALSWLYIDSREHVWIPTHRGVSCYIPLRDTGSIPPLEISIDGIETGTGTLLRNPVPGGETAAISPDPGRMTISYTVPSVKYGSTIRYRYRLKGYENRWSGLSPQKSAVFTHPGYGKYLFQVEAVGQSGELIDKEVLTITIQRPLYHYLLMAAAVILAASAAGIILLIKRGSLQKGNRAGMPEELHTLSGEHSLTAREQAIIRLAFSGKRDKEIAGEMGCATSTVSNSLSRIYKKLSIGSRSELIKLLSSGG